MESTLAEDRRLVLGGAADEGAVRPYTPIVAALRAYKRAVPDGLRDSGTSLGDLVRNLLTKLGCRSRTAATRRAVELGLLKTHP